MIGCNNYGDGIKESFGIPSSNDTVIFNPAFSRWEQLILAVVDTSSAGDALGNRYQKEIASGLLKECMTHARENRNKTESEKALCLVHPFYLPLADFCSLFNERYKNESRKYLLRLSNAMRLAKENGIETVLFETAQHYASTTSLLAEQGLISRVIFTEADDGLALRRHQQEELLGKELFFSGCYNGLCLTTSMRGMLKKGVEKNKLNALPELVLEAPYHYELGPNPAYPSTLVPEGVVIATTRKGTRIYLPKEQICGIDELFGSNP